MGRGQARYDEVADDYAAMFGDQLDDPATSALLELLGEVQGSHVLDAPCGQGRVARDLARGGAKVVGVDLSVVLLEKARELEESASLGVEYLHADITASDTLADEVFDGVVCNFGFSDIDDLDGALSTFTRVLRASGVFVFSLLHPCFPGWPGVSGAWPPEGYYEERFWRPEAAGSELRREVGSNHRMLSTYLNALVAHGLVIEELFERALDPWPIPDVNPMPMFLAGRCRKG
jgi:SAM-dependent methyltransferase